MEQVTPSTQLKFRILSRVYMFRSCEDIIRLTLEHLKGYKNCKMLETGPHVYKLCFMFPKQFNTLRTGDANLRFYITSAQDG